MREAVQKVVEFLNIFWETNIWEVSHMDKCSSYGSSKVLSFRRDLGRDLKLHHYTDIELSRSL